MTLPTIPYTLLEAIARAEGFYEDGDILNRPQRNCNPCDLEWHPWMAAFGSNTGDPRFAVFLSSDQGFAAARHLFSFPLYKGKTISQALAIFAPGNENNLRVYLANVLAWTEQQPDSIIDGILG